MNRGRRASFMETLRGHGGRLGLTPLQGIEETVREFTGTCPIREHTGDDHYVGRCDFATYDGFCPRHGALVDYPTNDDREVRVEDRRWR